MRFWDTVEKVATVAGRAIILNQQVDDLMEMGEAAGMAHLGAWVPQLIENDGVDYVIRDLRNRETDERPDYRRKAKTFRVHTEVLVAGHSF